MDLAEDGMTIGLGTGSPIATSGQSAYSPASYRTHPTTLEAPWLSRRFDCSSPMSTARSLPRQGSYRPDDRRGGEADGGRDCFAVTSARPPRGLAILIDPLELSTPIAAFNGGLIARPDMTVIEQQLISDEVTPAVIELLAAHAMSVWTYRGTDWFSPGPARAVCGPGGPDGRVRPDAGRELHAGLGWGGQGRGGKRQPQRGPEDGRDSGTRAVRRPCVGNSVAAVLRRRYPPQANKGGVVRCLFRRYRIPAEEIATIGDGPNDVLMFAPSRTQHRDG